MATDLAVGGVLLLRYLARHRGCVSRGGGICNAQCLGTNALHAWTAWQQERGCSSSGSLQPYNEPGGDNSSCSPGFPCSPSASLTSTSASRTALPVALHGQQLWRCLLQQQHQQPQQSFSLMQQRASSTSRTGQQKDKGKPAVKAKARPVREKALNFKRNQQIRDPTVRVVLPEGGSQLLPVAEALALAQSRGLDLVEVSRSSEGPVTKLVDYSKFLFEAKQAAKDADKKAREKAKLSVPKEMHFTARIADHDLEVKMRRVAEFLADGYRVSLVVKHGRSEAEAAGEAAEYLATRLHTEYGAEALPKQVGARSVTITVKPVQRTKAAAGALL